jgi:MFS family permease
MCEVKQAESLGQEQRIIRQITWRLIPFLILLYTVAYIDRSTLGFAKLQMSADIGLSDAAYGLGAGLFFIGYFLFEVPSNLFLTRVGARRWFARILITWGVVTAFMAAIRTPTQFYLLRFLLGVAEAGFYPGVVYYLTCWFPQRHLARIFGIFLISQPGALILTGPLSGYILRMDGAAGLRGWQWLFLLSGAPAILLALPTLKLLPERPGTATWLDKDSCQWLEAELSRDHAQGSTRHGNPLHALKDRRVLLLALYFLPFPLAIYGLALWLPTIVSGFGHSTVTTGYLYAVPYLFAVIGLYIVPRSSDRLNERYGHIAFCAGIGTLGLALSALLPSLPLQLTALCLTAFGLYAGQAVLWTLPARFLSGASAAAGVALINSIGNLGGYIGPYAIGVIKQHTSSVANGMYLLAGALFLVVLLTPLVQITLRREPLQQNHAYETSEPLSKT